MILGKDPPLYTLAAAVILTIPSYSMFILDTISIVVLSKCIRIAKQHKTLLKNLLFCDSVVHLTLAILFTLLVIIKDANCKFFVANILSLMLNSAVLMYCILVLVIAFERLLAVGFPNAYYRILSSTTVKRIIIISYLSVVAFMVGVSMSLFVYCQEKFPTCRKEIGDFFLKAKAVPIFLFILADISVAVAGVYVFKVSREHASRLRSQYPSTRLNTKIPALRIMLHVGVFIFMFSAALIYIAVTETTGLQVNSQSKSLVRTLAYICTLTNSIVSLHYYVITLQEFRLVCRRLFCHWNNKIAANYERRRMEIYNIPTRTISLDRSLQTYNSNAV